MSTTTHRRIIIGDVHGHYQGLMKLLEAIAPSAEDQVYFLGDLIDRGPNSADVVRFVQKSGYACVLGNHEQLLLDSFPQMQLAVPALQAWLYSGGQTTVESYKDISLLLEDVEWIKTLPTHIDLGDVWLAHAGIHPGMALEDQTANTLCWIREEFHSMSSPYFADKLIITGHTITFTLPGVAPGEIAQGHGWLDIDTGAYHPRSGWMTGLDVTNQIAYQINVFQDSCRKLPLAEVTSWVDPAKITTRHSSRRQPAGTT